METIAEALQPAIHDAFTLDHAVPLSRSGDLLDAENARRAHHTCNSARGNRAAGAVSLKASRRW
ncbi:HNH endonuclease [Streptomyces sp. NBC_00005]|uniref:HNH endonuclease n=1 Tax=Streptomyces sp. NBC_00005 TaxID=2903609 RepID=UPI0032458236